MEKNRPIVATIVVTHQLPRGIIAKVNGQAQWFPNLAALFRTALTIQDGGVKDRCPTRSSPD
jgi:hypothetical protein